LPPSSDESPRSKLGRGRSVTASETATPMAAALQGLVSLPPPAITSHGLEPRSIRSQLNENVTDYGKPSLPPSNRMNGEPHAQLRHSEAIGSRAGSASSSSAHASRASKDSSLLERLPAGKQPSLVQSADKASTHGEGSTQALLSSPAALMQSVLRATGLGWVPFARQAESPLNLSEQQSRVSPVVSEPASTRAASEPSANPPQAQESPVLMPSSDALLGLPPDAVQELAGSVLHPLATDADL